MLHCRTSRLLLSLSLAVALGGIIGCAADPPTDDSDPTTETSPVSEPDSDLAQDPDEVADDSPEATPVDWAMADMTHVLEGHDESPTKLVFSPDGQTLAIASYDALKVWDVASGQVLHRLEGHRPAGQSPMATVPPTAMVMSPDGQTLATTSRSQGRLSTEDSLILWDLNSGEAQQTLGGDAGCQDVAFTSDGSQLWAACAGELQRWSLDNGSLETSMDVGLLETIALSPDGQTLATVEMNLPDGSQDSTQVQLWDVGGNSAEPLRSLQGDSHDITNLQFTPDGRYLVTQTPAIWANDGSGGSPGQVDVWDWQQGERRYQHESSSRFPVSISADGNLLAGQFGEALLIDMQGNPVNTSILTRQQGGASAIALSPDGKTLAWAGQPPTFPTPIVRLWQAGAATEPTHESADGDRDQYTSLEELPSERTTRDIERFTQDNFGLTETVGIEEETLTLNMPDTNRAEAILTLDSLPDDSVGAVRYRLEFDLQEDGVTWELVWAGRQQQCRRGPTPEDEWTTELCT
ncbi:WD40 repeat domain-containing protein [Sodalinema gerasimenkoae]|uniref:WD40 repeat domain-containing protein n=1 Tax=Sodalinema gerasimenkoae TaxID=2862348 RepID=UPI00135CA219|nr:PD40 domain-containing protein [Sodalinema gerasimenkoae]